MFKDGSYIASAHGALAGAFTLLVHWMIRLILNLDHIVTEYIWQARVSMLQFDKLPLSINAAEDVLCSILHQREGHSGPWLG